MEKYTGSGDPKAWINTYANSLDAARIPPSSWHVYFCRNLDGPASKWYKEEVQLADKPYWDKLRVAFEAKWIPLNSTLTPATSVSVVVSTVPPINTKTTYDTFRELIEEANIETIKKLINTAGTTFDSERTELLWNRAFAEGYQAGRQAMLKNLDIKLEKEYDEGYQRGIEESKLKYFGMGLEDGRTTEHAEWVEKGHGNCCFSPIRVAVRDDASTQTDTQCTITTSIATQTSSPAAFLSATMVQTDPVGIPDPPSPTATYGANSTQTTPQTTSTSPSSSPASSMSPPSSLAQPPSLSSTALTTATNTTSPATNHLATPQKRRHTLVDHPTTSHSTPKTSDTHLAQPTSRSLTSSSTITTNHSPASNQLPTPRNRRHTLPDNYTTSHMSPQASFTPPIRRHSTITLSTLTATPVSKNTPKTSNLVTFSRQKVPATSETKYMMSNEVQGLHKTRETEEVEHHDDQQAGTSKYVVCSSERRDTLHNPAGRSRSLSVSSHYSKPPNLPQNHQKQASSAPVEFHTPATSSTFKNSSIPSPVTVSRPTAPPNTTTGPKMPSMTTGFTQNHPETPKSPILTCLDWADDAYTVPDVPMFPQHPPRDLSGLRSTSPHPFSSLRRRRDRPKNQWNIQHRYASGHNHSYRFHQYHPRPKSVPIPIPVGVVASSIVSRDIT